MINEDVDCFVTVEELQALVGQIVSRGQLMHITQQMIEAFAEVTGDRQFIHVDVERAQNTMFGGTVAHGMFILALVLGSLANNHVDGFRTRLKGRLMVNLGISEVRFLSPVPVGSFIFSEIKLLEISSPERGNWVDTTKEHSVYVEGASTPALIAKITVRTYQ